MSDDVKLRGITVKMHASIAAGAVAHGSNVRTEYSRIVRDYDLTLGECGALRNEIDKAVIERLQELQRIVDLLKL